MMGMEQPSAFTVAAGMYKVIDSHTCAAFSPGNTPNFLEDQDKRLLSLRR